MNKFCMLWTESIVLHDMVSLPLVFVLFFAALDSKASNLSVISQKYRKDARYLNLRSTYAKIAAIVIVIIVLLLFLRYTIWWSVISTSTEKADIVRTWNQCCVLWLFIEIKLKMRLRLSGNREVHKRRFVQLV